MWRKEFWADYWYYERNNNGLLGEITFSYVVPKIECRYIWFLFAFAVYYLIALLQRFICAMMIIHLLASKD